MSKEALEELYSSAVLQVADADSIVNSVATDFVKNIDIETVACRQRMMIVKR